MAMMLEIWPHKEIHSVIKFFWQYVFLLSKFSVRWWEVYLDIMGGHHVRKWCRVFAGGQMEIHSDVCTICPSLSRMGVNVHRWRNWFWKTDETIWGCQFDSSEEVKMAICEWLWMLEPNFYHDRIFKLFTSWKNGVSMLGDYVEVWLYL
jgi:hypothetical protein